MHVTATKLERPFEWSATAKAVVPLAVLPAAACILFASAPPWQQMWSLAIALYFGFKWFTFAMLPPSQRGSLARAVAYLFFWPGMNAAAFCDDQATIASPPIREWLLAVFKLSVGVMLICVIAPRWQVHDPRIAGWIGMIGLAFVLHFGLFHLLALVWRTFGIAAEPIMDFPILSASLGEFWGRRWNLAFRDLVFSHFFRPVAKHIGVAGATMAVFIASGVVHDLVISLPVRSGWGGPTAYFFLQGAGLLLERSRIGQSLSLGRGFIGRMYCAVLILAPIRLLFHDAFIIDAIQPTLAAFGSG